MARGKGSSGGKKATGAKRGGGRRRSRAEDMTEAKDNTVETSPVLPIKPVEIDERTFDVQYKAMRNLTDQKDSIVGLLRSQRKQLNDCGPEVRDAVNRALQLDGKTPDQIKRQLEIEAFLLKKRESTVQISLHNVLLGDVLETAYKLGYQDGAAGRTAKCDYPEGSDLAKEYGRGWRHGTAKNLGMSPEESDAAEASGVGDGDEEPLWNDDPPHLAEEAGQGASTH